MIRRTNKLPRPVHRQFALFILSSFNQATKRRDRRAQKHRCRRVPRPYQVARRCWDLLHVNEMVTAPWPFTSTF